MSERYAAIGAFLLLLLAGILAAGERATPTTDPAPEAAKPATLRYRTLRHDPHRRLFAPPAFDADADLLPPTDPEPASRGDWVVELGQLRQRYTVDHIHTPSEWISILDVRTQRLRLGYQRGPIGIRASAVLPQHSKQAYTRDIFGIQPTVFGTNTLAPALAITRGSYEAYDLILAFPVASDTDLEFGHRGENLRTRIEWRVPGSVPPVAQRRLQVKTAGYLGLHARWVQDWGCLIGIRGGLTQVREELRGIGEAFAISDGVMAPALSPNRRAALATVLETTVGYQFPPMGATRSAFTLSYGVQIGIKSESERWELGYTLRF